MAKLENLKPGQQVWHVQRKQGYYPVEVISTNPEDRTITVYWNCNKQPMTFNENWAKKLRLKEPK